MLKFLTFILLFAAGMATAVLAAPPAVAIESRQLMGSAPATFRVRITLEPDARNRYLCLQWTQVSGGNEKTSCWSVQAEREARTTWKELRDLPAGKYLVAAWVVRNDEQGVISNTLTLHVIGFGYDLE